MQFPLLALLSLSAATAVSAITCWPSPNTDSDSDQTYKMAQDMCDSSAGDWTPGTAVNYMYSTSYDSPQYEGTTPETFKVKQMDRRTVVLWVHKRNSTAVTSAQDCKMAVNAMIMGCRYPNGEKTPTVDRVPSNMYGDEGTQVEFNLVIQDGDRTYTKTGPL
ncbi:hypothetical protein EDC01DRAFT_745337 [Geopyxis carbonaria]|nr:hypothetical protein EDC01DRAFT_745337 [Geopyxis carbonaria]